MQVIDKLYGMFIWLLNTLTPKIVARPRGKLDVDGQRYDVDLVWFGRVRNSHIYTMTLGKTWYDYKLEKDPLIFSKDFRYMFRYDRANVYRQLRLSNLVDTGILISFLDNVAREKIRLLSKKMSNDVRDLLLSIVSSVGGRYQLCTDLKYYEDAVSMIAFSEADDIDHVYVDTFHKGVFTGVIVYKYAHNRTKDQVEKYTFNITDYQDLGKLWIPIMPHLSYVKPARANTLLMGSLINYCAAHSAEISEHMANEPSLKVLLQLIRGKQCTN